MIGAAAVAGLGAAGLGAAGLGIGVLPGLASGLLGKRGQSPWKRYQKMMMLLAPGMRRQQLEAGRAAKKTAGQALNASGLGNTTVKASTLGGIDAQVGRNIANTLSHLRKEVVQMVPLMARPDRNAGIQRSLNQFAQVGGALIGNQMANYGRDFFRRGYTTPNAPQATKSPAWGTQRGGWRPSWQNNWS